MHRLLSSEGISENLRFMVLEVQKQVENSRAVLEHPDGRRIEAIQSRDDYIDALKSVIENKCFSAIHRQGHASKRSVDLLRAVATVTSNLERIADFAVNVVDQTRYLEDSDFIRRYDFGKFYKEVLAALELVYDALTRQDMALAFKICRSEFSLDYLYKVQFDRILNELRSGAETENLITSHLILRYLERMGDSLLNIGEACIFAAVGEKFKIRQYEALRETLAKSGMDTPISDVEFHSIWGTRSGCRIGKVSDGRRKEDGSEPSAGVLFKEGARGKLLLEKENIERWEAIMPGLPPKVLAHSQEDGQASLLVEFLGGCTYQDVVLANEPEILANASFLLHETMLAIWEGTKAYGPDKAGFLDQLVRRLDDVYRLHPSLKGDAKSIGALRVRSLEEIIEEVRPLEDELVSPYTVFIHGDFNINNIIYDHASQQIRYIDLHRSRQTDPVQDISVFLVSNFRLPIFEPPLRRNLRRAALDMLGFARDYAARAGDETMEARLALGLARSFVTSTRFELNRRFVKAMFIRGVYLLERLLNHKGRPWKEFRLLEDVFTY